MKESDHSGEVVPLFEYFRDVFVPESRLELPVKEAHRVCCDTLEDAFLGNLPPNIEFVIVNLCPRVGKTKIAEAFVTWGEGFFPDSQWIYTSYSGDLAEKSLAYIAATMKSPWYCNLFGDHVHGSPADHMSTTSGGNVFAEGSGGSLTGKGAGLKRPAGGALIIDDASKPDSALSIVQSQNVRDWFENTVKNRRNSDRWCPIIIIGQRLAGQDLPGYIMSTYPENTLVLKFPALVEGESMFPETVSSATLLAYQKTRMGRFVLASQYQQEPIALGGNLIPIDEFMRWDVSEAFALKWEKLVITVDTALKTKEANDFSCAALWGKINNRAYMIDLLHGKWDAPDLLANTTTFYKKWKDTPGWPMLELIIEEKAAGTPLMDNLRRNGIPCKGIERDVDKVRRVQNILPFIESHMVYIPKPSSAVPWLAKFEAECSEFTALMNHTHDDMVDTMCDGVWLTLGRPMSILDILGGNKK